jgi:hypothetical protein
VRFSRRGFILVGAAQLFLSCERVPHPELDKPTHDSADGAPRPISASEHRDPRWSVSIFELLARPKDFSGQILTVSGYLRMDVEEQLLYVSEEFARVGVIENAVAIDATGCMTESEDTALLKKLENFRNSYVSITGRFMKTDPTKNVFQAGRLCSIHDLKPIAAQAKPRSSADAGRVP